MTSRTNLAGAGVRIVDAIDKTGLDEQGWNALASRGTSTIFQTFQWHQSWLSAYGPQLQRFIIVADDGHAITGLAPLVVEHTAQGRIARFIGDGRSDYCDFLAGHDPAVIATLVRALSDSDRWDLLALRNVPAESASIELFRNACRDAGLRTIVRDQFICPTLMIRGSEVSAQTILNKPALRRRTARLQRIGRFTCRNFRTAAEVLPKLDEFFDQHVERWAATETPSLFRDPVNRRFYRELTSNLDGTDWLLFSVVELDDKPIAFHYGFDFNETVIWYKPSFDPAWARRSPGLVLVHHLIDYALGAQRRELDFTVGDEAFKLRFTNYSRRTVEMLVFRDPARYAYERSKLGVRDAYRRVTTWGKGS